MKLEAKERQSGVYGTVNAGDTVTVPNQLGEELLEVGTFKKAVEEAAPATADEVQARNVSGDTAAPIHVDGTERELLNTDGRKLHDPQADQIVATQQEIEKKAEEADKTAETVEKEKQQRSDGSVEVAATDKAVKDAKSAAGRQTKDDKAATTEATK